MSKASNEVYRRIRESILSGEFAPGTRLKENELVELCGYSRTPVREALRKLASEDYITINTNQGAEVKTWSSDEIDDLFHLRSLLEGYSASRAAKNISLIQLKKVNDSITEMDRILAKEGNSEDYIEDFLRLNQVIHNTIWEAAGSERLESMLSRLIEQALVARTARQFTIERLSQSHNHHKELYNALKSHDEAWAESIMRSHIHAARDALLVSGSSDT